VSGQDLRESRLVDEYARQKAAAGQQVTQQGADVPDIRLKFRAMQVLEILKSPLYSHFPLRI